MSQWAKTHQPCPCGQSSDAYAIDAEDGHGKCFSCGKFFKGDIVVEESPQWACTYEYLPRRGIAKETHEFFGVKTQIDANGKPVSVAYQYPNGAIQVRFLEKKSFMSNGPMSAASGWAVDKFTPGSAKAITITEGNDDAMSVWQMLGKYPVYAIKSASSCLRDVRADYDHLNSFEKIYLALDADAPGQKATAEIASVFDPRKIYHVKLNPYKDPHDFLENGKIVEFRNAWYGAHRYLPEGIVSSFADIDTILDNATQEPGHPWPFTVLNRLTDGIKPGRAYLVSGLEGIGKTEFFHAVEYHLAETDPDANMAIMHLEEPLDENIKKKAGYKLKLPTVLSDSSVSKDEIKAAYRSVAKRDDRLYYYNHYGSDDHDVLLAKIRFFVAACRCKYVFLDNITVTATGRHTEDERKELDYFSTKLEMLVKELKFALVVISHENDDGKTRGSRNISKVFDVWIKMFRNIEAESEHERNTLVLRLAKGRGCRGTGPAGALIYDPGTGTLGELTNELPS